MFIVGDFFYEYNTRDVLARLLHETYQHFLFEYGRFLGTTHFASSFEWTKRRLAHACPITSVDTGKKSIKLSQNRGSEF